MERKTYICDVCKSEVEEETIETGGEGADWAEIYFKVKRLNRIINCLEHTHLLICKKCADKFCQIIYEFRAQKAHYGGKELR